MNNTRIEQLTVTRFIAAIAVVFFHYAQQLYPFNSQCLTVFVENGNLAVGYFFCAFWLRIIPLTGAK